MTKKHYTDEQKLAILKEVTAGLSVPEICRKYNRGTPQKLDSKLSSTNVTKGA